MAKKGVVFHISVENIRIFHLDVWQYKFHDVDIFYHSASFHGQLYRNSAILFSSHFVSSNNCVFVSNNSTQRAVHTVRSQLRLFIVTHRSYRVQCMCPHGVIATMTPNPMQLISCDKQIAVSIGQCISALGSIHTVCQ